MHSDNINRNAARTLVILVISFLAFMLNGCSYHIRASERFLNEGTPKKAAIIISANAFLSSDRLEYTTYKKSNIPPQCALKNGAYKTYLGIKESKTLTDSYGKAIAKELAARNYEVTSVDQAGVGYCTTGCRDMLVREDFIHGFQDGPMVQMSSNFNAVIYEPTEFTESHEYGRTVNDIFFQLKGGQDRFFGTSMSVKNTPRLLPSPLHESLNIIRERTGADMACFYHLEQVMHQEISLSEEIIDYVVEKAIDKAFDKLFGSDTNTYTSSHTPPDIIRMVGSCLDTRSGEVVWERHREYFISKKGEYWDTGGICHTYGNSYFHQDKNSFIVLFHDYLPEATKPYHKKCSKSEYSGVIKCPSGSLKKSKRPLLLNPPRVM